MRAIVQIPIISIDLFKIKKRVQKIKKHNSISLKPCQFAETVTAGSQTSPVSTSTPRSETEHQKVSSHTTVEELIITSSPSNTISETTVNSHLAETTQTSTINRLESKSTDLIRATVCEIYMIYILGQ